MFLLQTPIYISNVKFLQPRLVKAHGQKVKNYDYFERRQTAVSEERE